MNYDYVLGIDFGHGETSAALWNTHARAGEDISDLDIGRKIDPSAVGTHINPTVPSIYTVIPTDAGPEVRIGVDALSELGEDIRHYSVHACFKHDPLTATPAQLESMVTFMTGVYRRILEQRPELGSARHVVYIAAPSQWKAASLTAYGDLARRAGLPLPPTGGVLREARAAMRTLMESVGDAGPKREAEQGAVVLDMGSSTLDMTYFDGSGACLDNGADVGASRVEQAMLEDLRKGQELLNKFAEGGEFEQLSDWLLLQIRIRKEIYFSSQAPHRVSNSIELDNYLPEEDSGLIRIKYLNGALEALLDRVGYTSLVRKALERFASENLKGKPLKAVFLTGGASRMDFLRGLVSEALGVASDKVHTGQCDPSVVVSRGIVEECRHLAAALAASAAAAQAASEQAALETRNKRCQGLMKDLGSSIKDAHEMCERAQSRLPASTAAKHSAEQSASLAPGESGLQQALGEAAGANKAVEAAWSEMCTHATRLNELWMSATTASSKGEAAQLEIFKAEASKLRNRVADLLNSINSSTTDCEKAATRATALLKSYQAQQQAQEKAEAERRRRGEEKAAKDKADREAEEKRRRLEKEKAEADRKAAAAQKAAEARKAEAELQRQTLIRNINQHFDAIGSGYDMAKGYKQCLEQQLNERIDSKMRSSLNGWKQLYGTSSLNELSKRFESGIEKGISDAMDFARTSFRDDLERSFRPINELLSKYDRGGGFRVNEQSIGQVELSSGDINIDSVLENLKSDLSSTTLGDILVGGGMVTIILQTILRVLGPVGWLLSALPFIAGKLIQWFSSVDENTQLDRATRDKASEALLEKWPELKRSIQSAVAEALSKEDITGQVLATVTKCVREYRSKLRCLGLEM